MSCDDCETAQMEPQIEYYVRIGNGNVLISGCENHVKQIMELIRR